MNQNNLGAIIKRDSGLYLVMDEAEQLTLCPVGQKGEVVIGMDDLTEGELPWAKAFASPSHAVSQAADGLEPLARISQPCLERIWRAKMASDTGRFHELFHKKQGGFTPGSDPVPVSGRVYGAGDMQSLVDSSLDFWLTTGRFNDEFEAGFSSFTGLKKVLTVNSGSSANLLAIASLTSPKLGERALKPGDEVITVAAGFPTTVNPILQHGLVPVFVDVDLGTYNIDASLLDAALSDKTRAVFLAHTLGNPFDIAAVKAFCDAHGLWLIEDCCDALGSLYALPGEEARFCGTFGDIATFSFYPAHHITMGEGGALGTNDKQLYRLIMSYRDWGRDCWCPPGHDNTCKHRFDGQYGELPPGYDHKYVYSHVGYNLKISDMQAAVGLAQLEHLPGFIETRKRNFEALTEKLVDLKEHLLLPRATENARPSWFGYPISLTSDAPGLREDLMRFMNERRIGTRLLFGGNLVRQPYFAGQSYRVAGDLSRTDEVMNKTFWLGVYPGLGDGHIAYMAESLHEFFSKVS